MDNVCHRELRKSYINLTLKMIGNSFVIKENRRVWKQEKKNDVFKVKR